MSNGLAMHPAWQCAHRKLTNQQRWDDREAGLPSGYFDAEIALAMVVGGFGPDLVVTARDEEGNPKAYAFPDVWLVVDEDAGRRMGPSLRLMRLQVTKNTFADMRQERKLQGEYALNGR